jgi:hypothetical protein
MKEKERLINEVLAISEYIRYIAVYDNDGLSMKQRNDIDNVSSNESDKYEELLVNPVLIKLASQRGNIDCGGLEYFIIRCGNFFVLLIPCNNGHVNIGIEPDKNPFSFVDSLSTLLRKYNLRK